jgi:hypothetical protein
VHYIIFAILAGIAMGIILHSIGWGIVTFFLIMIIFTIIASWVFESPIDRKFEIDDELNKLLDKLEIIGIMKNNLPLGVHGWINSLGLYVQLKDSGRFSGLEAGEK